MKTALVSDVAIIGGGPAGMSCALWLKDYAIDTLLIDRNDTLGGALLISHYANRWVLGQEDCNGLELARRYAAHVQHSGIRIQANTEIKSAKWSGEYFLLEAEEASCKARALVIAPGMAYADASALKGVEGVGAACKAGKITFGQPAPKQLEQFKNVDIAVIGSGDNGLETAIDFAKNGCNVSILVRGSALHGQSRLKKELAKHKNIAVLYNAPISAFALDANGVTIKTTGDKSVRCEHVFALLGYVPQTAWAAAQFPGLKRDPKQFIITDEWMHTSVPWLYAAGDVVRPHHPCVLSAMDTGSLVARSIQRDFDKAWNSSA